MAIGNAPWPIGVTMVGIHARTGREKIFAQNVARILFLSSQQLSNFVVKKNLTNDCFHVAVSSLSDVLVQLNEFNLFF